MKQKIYPSDLRYAQWLILLPLIPPPKRGGRNRQVDMYKVVCAMFYVARSGCSWRMIPKDYPCWQTVYGYFRAWQENGVWEAINDALREAVRTKSQRDAQPSLGIVDAQSVKMSRVAGLRGFDRFKMTKGRKRHLLVDTMGLILALYCGPANDQDRKGAYALFKRAAKKGFSRLEKIIADGGYNSNPLAEWLFELTSWVLELVQRPKDQKGFVVLTRRWVVERTFGWLTGYRRLARDYESTPESAEAMIYIAMIHLMLNRLGKDPQLWT